MMPVAPFSIAVSAIAGVFAIRYGTRLARRAAIEDPQGRATISENARQFRKFGALLVASSLASMVMLLINRR